ncbi:MAG: DUF4916 domain-containing protein, partial [Catenulispora sp.]
MIETTPGWFAPSELEQIRSHLPIVYVQAVP